jgi:c-di-GMP-binding flagellar brake protein YcgR
MIARYWDRRRYIRVPASGPARWRSGRHAGHCELLDISPGGAGLRLPVRKAKQLGARIALEVELSPGVKWHIATEARVVRQQPEQDGMCLVGVEFGTGGPKG